MAANDSHIGTTHRRAHSRTARRQQPPPQKSTRSPFCVCDEAPHRSVFE